MCFKVTRCDHKLQDPTDIPLTDLTISSSCVYLKSHGWLTVDVPRASEGKEAIEKSGPLGRGLGGATAAASATRWHHWPLRKHLTLEAESLEPSSDSSDSSDSSAVFPQRTWALSVCRCRHGPPPQTQAFAPGRCSFRLVLSSRVARQDGPGR